MIKEKEAQPLVSVVVVTYNSSEYVIETLESAKSQTYTNIELIVSDDCSKDNTVEICQKWIRENKKRFVRTEIITSAINTGTPSNCNRGVKASKGEWIKLIAGDDALINNCISSNIDYSKSNSEITIIHSNYEWYNDDFNNSSYVGTTNLTNNNFCNSSITAKEQYKLLLLKNRVNALTIFLKRKTLIEIGGFDERFRLIEDGPMWINFTKHKYKIYYLDNKTVKYRKKKSDIKNKNPFTNSVYAKELLMFNKIYKINNISLFNSFRYTLGCKYIILLNILGLNRNNYLSHLLFYLANKIIWGMISDGKTYNKKRYTKRLY